jgi:hypothetical protein
MRLCRTSVGEDLVTQFIPIVEKYMNADVPFIMSRSTKALSHR